MRGDERAVSDVLAFIIVFSIIITSVALVYGTGFSSLDQVRSGEQKMNAERAMEALAYSMNDIVTGSANSRSGSLNLGGGLLQVDDSTRVEVVVENSSGTQVFTDDRTTRSFAYTLGTTTVAYENGAVLRSDRDASVDVQRASMTCTDDLAIVSLVVVRPGPDTNALDSQGSVEITMEEVDTKLLYTDQNGASSNDVTVEMTGTQFDNGWDQSMDSSGWDVDTGASEEYNCENVENVVVRVTVIEIRFGSP